MRASYVRTASVIRTTLRPGGAPGRRVAAVECAYFDAGVCRSCRWMGVGYAEQLARKQGVAEAAVGGALDETGAVEWLAPVPSREAGFRNKAKMVVAGTAEAPTVGILDAAGHGVDLRECGLYTPGIRAALPVLAEFVSRARLTPYDVPSRRGELKHVLVTESPDGELMVRWVLRSTESVARLRKHLPELRAPLPHLAVASANILAEHKAVLEGQVEVPLTESQHLRMVLGGLSLYLRPQGFFQTNSEIAAALYAQARAWVVDADPASLWDLYCGVGGFALHCAESRGGVSGVADGGSTGRPRTVVGVETSAEAVVAARRSAAEAGLDARFVAGDATAYALAADAPPDLVVVNPPRRGIGGELAGWLESSGVVRVLYSSCDATSLARDLAAMPSLRPVRARVFDMFPQTDHFETLVLLERGSAQA